MSDTNETTDIDAWIDEQFSTINDSLTLFKMQITNLQKIVKTVEKDVSKKLKRLKKDKNYDKPKTKRAPSGFAKPTKVTNELCEFMGKPTNSEIARTEATKALVKYIQEHNLMTLNEDSKNIIMPDDKLKSLLGIQHKNITDLTYFNIQKYMNQHFNPNADKEITITA
jgi:chromatin remodeling complex protein RSC6